MVMDSDNKDIGILTDPVSEATCTKCGCKIDVTGLEPFVSVECPDCHSIENVPAKLGQFQLLHLIGKGGMGGVYYAVDTALGRHVAIKVMLQSLGDNAEFVDTFKREAQAVAKLNHPNICQIYAFGKEKGQPYIVMELVNGQRLDKLMEGGKQVDQALVMKISVDIAEALQAANEVGLVHGDIKPENILLDEKGQTKLVDFGLATFAHQASEGIWGTPYYISPEKIRRQPVDARSDIYSLGATLYHALAGRPPFEGKTPIDVVKVRLTKEPAAPSILCPKLDRFVEGIIMRMLQLQPARRYPNYSSLIGDLKKAVKVLGPARSYSSKPKQTLIIPKKTTSFIAGDSEKTKDDFPAPKSTKFHKVSSAGKPTGKFESDKPQPAVLGHSYADRLRQSVAKKEKKNIPGWVYGLIAVLAIGLIVTGVVVRIKNKNQAAREEAAEALRLKTEKNTAGVTYGTIQATIASVSKMTQTAESCISKATNAVFVVTGDVMTRPDPRKKPAAAPASTNEQVKTAAAAVLPVFPVISPLPAVHAVLFVHAAKAAKPKSKANPKTAAPAASAAIGNGPSGSPEMTAADGSGPPGEATREQLDRARKGEGAAEAVPPAPEEKKQAVPEVQENEPPVKNMTRKVFNDAAKLAEKVSAAQALEETATTARDAVLAAHSSSNAVLRNKQLLAVLESVKTIETDAKKLLEDCEKTAKDIDSIKVAFEEDAKAKQKAKEEEEKKIAAAQAEERKAAEQKALVESEIKLANAAREKVIPMLKFYNFKGAIDEIAAQQATFQTEEGKAAIKVFIDRCNYLQKMKSFITEQLKAEKFAWGWTQSGSTQDVLGADENGILIKGKTVLWPDVKPAQLLKIIEHCVGRSGISFRVRGDQNLACAILCYELGASAEVVKKYSDKAIDCASALKEEVARILPVKE